jgi:hypothetical protein
MAAARAATSEREEESEGRRDERPNNFCRRHGPFQATTPKSANFDEWDKKRARMCIRYLAYLVYQGRQLPKTRRKGPFSTIVSDASVSTRPYFSSVGQYGLGYRMLVGPRSPTGPQHSTAQPRAR